jgi:hypothetical protein
MKSKRDSGRLVLDAQDGVVAAVKFQGGLTVLAVNLQARVAAVRAASFPRRASVLL